MWPGNDHACFWNPMTAGPMLVRPLGVALRLTSGEVDGAARDRSQRRLRGKRRSESGRNQSGQRRKSRPPSSSVPNWTCTVRGLPLTLNVREQSCALSAGIFAYAGNHFIGARGSPSETKPNNVFRIQRQRLRTRIDDDELQIERRLLGLRVVSTIEGDNFNPAVLASDPGSRAHHRSIRRRRDIVVIGGGLGVREAGGTVAARATHDSVVARRTAKAGLRRSRRLRGMSTSGDAFTISLSRYLWAETATLTVPPAHVRNVRNEKSDTI